MRYARLTIWALSIESLSLLSLGVLADAIDLWWYGTFL